ncbi:MAG: caspase family protein [Bacteroidales bacterium]|nr:caspase family protein [Bacteroidales bacterium]MCK9499232.1 caspase family protein [Bacteroidales bacterium]
MKKLVFIILNLILCLSFLKAEKYALIIAIGEYDQSLTGWYPISAGNDIPLIEKTLLDLGFAEKNIMYLTDKDATKQGIDDALTELYSRISKGDHVVIHYSGHGHQIFDDNDDEIDGLDEALVCFDAPMEMYEGYTGKKHFRDDELGEWVAKFRIKLGANGHILLFLDSCHSGTGTRGSAKVRGGAPALVPAGWKPKNIITDEKVGFGINDKNAPSSRGAKKEELAKFVVFSGASANELNYETYDDENNAVGSLSYCIFKSFSQMKEGDSYRQVFSRIMAEMANKAPHQNPAIEGDIDFAVFGGDFQAQSEYFNLSSIRTDSLVEINGGRLSGINPGSIIVFVEPGTTNLNENTNILNSGTVLQTNNFFSQVKLDNKIKFESNHSAWAFVKTRTFTDQKLKVQLEENIDADIREALISEIQKSNFVEITEDNPEIFLNYKKTRGAKIIGINNAYYNTELNIISNSNTQSLSTDVGSSLNNYMQGKVIKDLDYYNEKYDVTMELIPVKAKIYEDGNFDILEYYDANSILVNDIPEYDTDMMALIKVTNYGTHKSYFNIIDIQPDGFINPVIPTVNDIDGREYVLEPGETAVLQNTLVMFGPPYGNEIFKLISGDKPFNLSNTITGHGNKTRGDSSNIFESALQIGQTGVNTRGAKTVSAKTKEDKICTYEYTFKIVE